ncbi:hypothetical protein MPSI1_003801 [Malassezia psittaci]|uniref:Zn(2)-C6 fungal-type domain-containing protein n=1 Tax=Malassezia psittaci TaxID=1821823 RepID=A0AAF0FEN3_9BASI|nr:hypothetical protein MPSI1_003801 [Malassezia psittaci]
MRGIARDEGNSMDGTSWPVRRNETGTHDSYTSPQDTHGAPPRKRTKKAQSCESCRRRKLKCDRGWPCGACRDRNEQHLCTWEDGIVPEHTGRDMQDGAQINDKLTSLESLISRVAQRLDQIESKLDTINAQPTGSHPLFPNVHDGAAALSISTPEARSKFLQMIDANHVGGFFGTSWARTTDDQIRRSLLYMHTVLPDESFMHQLIQKYENELDVMQSIISASELLERMFEILAFNAKLERDPSFIHQLSHSHLVQLVYSEALLFSVFVNVIILTNNGLFEPNYQEDNKSLHGQFIEKIEVGLSAINPYEDMQLDFVICVVLLFSSLCAICKPPVGATLFHHGIHVALLQDLDTEPPADLPEREKTRRMNLFAQLCIYDWFGLTVTKRLPALVADPVKYPSLFGTEAQLSECLSPNVRFKMKIAQLYGKASILQLQNDDYLYTCQLHEEAFRLRSSMPPEWCDGPMSENTRKMHSTFGRASLDFFLLRIHLRFYLRGWDDARYRLSCDTCFTSARQLLHVFRAAFSWKVPVRPYETLTKRPGDWERPEKVSVVARIWWLSSWGTAAALLLVKHLTILTERDESSGWDLERESIVQDLCIMSRLLQYLSPITKFASDGYEAMQRVAAHALEQSFNDQNPSDGNYMSHWASRILQAKSSQTEKLEELPGKVSEPMSLLDNLMNSGSDIVRKDTPDSTTHSLEFNRQLSQHSGENNSSSSASSATPSSSNRTEMNVDGSYPLPSRTLDSLDTFWTLFAASSALPTDPIPDTSQPPCIAKGGTPSASLTTSSNADFDLREDPFNPPSLGPAFAAQQKDPISSNPFQIPMDSLGLMTDDFIRLFEGHSTRLGQQEPSNIAKE